MKKAKFYFKPEISCSRFELVLPSRFLQHYEILSPFDFHKLARILPRHISFQTLNEKKLVRRLDRMGIRGNRKREILRSVAGMDGQLWAILRYLRHEVELSNTRRLLDEHPMNREAVKALKLWAAQWPTRPTRLT